MKSWKALAGVAAIAALVLTPLVASGAYANSDKTEQDASKVFVCKYVGTPGDGERLQTGDNPINPSINSIKGNFPAGHVITVGDTFSDAHGRSVVIALDFGQPKPPISACATTPDVARDAAWNLDVTPPTCDLPGAVTLTGTNVTIPATQTAPGTYTATFTATDGHSFADGTVTHDEPYTILPAIAPGVGDCPAAETDVATATIAVTAPSCVDRNGFAEFDYSGATVTSATLDSAPIDNLGDLVSGSYPDPAAGHWVITLTADDGFSFGDSATKVLDFVVPAALVAGDCVATALFDVDPTPPACDVDGALPAFLGDRDGYTLALTPSYHGPGTYTLTATADAGRQFAGGEQVLTKEVVVEHAIDPESVGCLVGDPESSPSPTVTATGTPAVIGASPSATPGDPSLAATGGADMTPLGIAGALVLIAGLATLVATRRLRIKR